MAQVHPADLSGGKGAAAAPALDEEAPTAAEPSKLSDLSAKQVELKTSVGVPDGRGEPEMQAQPGLLTNERGNLKV